MVVTRDTVMGDLLSADIGCAQILMEMGHRELRQ